MTVKYCIKTHDVAIPFVSVNTYYSDPKLNAVLATGEKFCITTRVTLVTGAGPSLTVGIELSNDNVNWLVRKTFLFTSPSQAGYELGDTTVGGRFMRVSANLDGTFSPRGLVEIWVTGRSFV